MPPSPKTWISVVLATVDVPPWTITAPPFTRIVPAASRETTMVLSCASPVTVSTPCAAENVAVTPSAGGVQQHTDGAGGGVGRDQVHEAVAVQVGRRHAQGVIAAGQEVQPNQRLEGAVPVAGEHGEIARGGPQLIRHGSVQPAVVIEVAQGQIATPAGLSGAEEGSLEGAVAITQQHPELKSVAIEERDAVDHQVGPAVAVDVAHGHGRRREVLAAGRKDQGRRERAVAVAQQHADGVAELFRRHHVEPAVAVEVTDRDRARGRADGQVDPGPEGAVAVAQQQAEGAARLFAVTRSRAPLRSKSPTATERGVWPTLRIWWFGWNEPSPLPSRTSTAGPAGPAVFRATSGRRSPLKSPTAADPAMPVAEAAVEDVGGDSRLERTIAVTQQHTQAALGGRKRSRVDDREIRLAVVVEVRHRDRAGMDADRESDRGAEN